MPNTPEEKKKVLHRLARIQGQTLALVDAIHANSPCSALLQQIAALRGAASGLMVEVLQFQLKETMMEVATHNPLDQPQNSASTQSEIDQIVRLLGTYLK